MTQQNNHNNRDGMQQGNFSEVDRLGCRLSLEINCALKYPAFNKNAFICRCGITFPLYRLRGSDNWTWVKEEHERSKSRY